MSRLRHPNIVQYYGSETVSSYICKYYFLRCHYFIKECQVSGGFGFLVISMAEHCPKHQENNSWSNGLLMHKLFTKECLLLRVLRFIRYLPEMIHKEYDGCVKRFTSILWIDHTLKHLESSSRLIGFATA